MNNEFNFVGANLAKAEAGATARQEINELFADFKSAIRDACAKQFQVEVSFEPARLMPYGMDMFERSLVMPRLFHPLGVRTTNVAEPKDVVSAIEVYVGGRDGVRIFRYKINPISGYPVDVMYASKTVECSNKNELMAIVRDAYDLAVLQIRNLCAHS